MMIEPGNQPTVAPIVPVKLPQGTAGLKAECPKTPEKEKAPDVSQIADLTANIQNSLNMIHDVAMDFSVHKASGRVMVTISDEKTGDVIREIPSAEVLKLSARLDEMVGLLFDQKG
jgi:flagellar protein FlaG